MANSKYEYVRSFEQLDNLLANTWIVVRIDGRGFSKLTAKYKFTKPNDRRALDLMNASAEAVMKELPDLVLAYGNSDEFSFVFHKDCVLFERRESKLTTTIVSTFTSYYTFQWSKYFPDTPLTPPLPSFDGRAVCYPSDFNLRDYMSWRQVDCHINNLYNTTFWALVQQGGMEARAAEEKLKGTVSSDKNEILFSQFGINYNNEPEIFRKGSVLYRDFFPTSSQSSPMPRQAAELSPPLSQPQPRTSLARPMSQPLERTLPDLFSGSNSPASTASTPRGPTFLSTSTTPSPPPSPPSMSYPTTQNPLPPHPVDAYPQTFVPVSHPSNGNGAASAMHSKLPVLTPLPLPPPTLKPSTKPPSSLNPPNLTAHTNTSPMPSPNPVSPGPIPARTTSNSSSRKPIKQVVSHSASASLSRPVTTSASAKPTLKHRSPSLSILEGGRGPPEIPLRISSIPMNNKPRKLSLPTSQKSFSHLRPEDKENAGTTGTKVSPLRELPSPQTPLSPPIDDLATRNAVMGSEPQVWTASPVREGGQIVLDRETDTSPTHGEMSDWIPNPIIPTSPPAKSARRSQSHSRLHSAPTSFSSHAHQPPIHTHNFNKPDWASPSIPQSNTKSKLESKKAKSTITEEGGWAAGTRGHEGRPVQLSKTQKDKDRKKRTRARIVIEHVDIIRDEFWERRPWILSGKTS